MEKGSQTELTLRVAILFFREMWLYLSWVQRQSLGRTAKWLWSQWPQTVLIHQLEAVCAKMCTQVTRDWKAAGNARRGSLIRGPRLQRVYVHVEGGEQVRGHYRPRGNDQSRKSMAALVCPHRRGAWRLRSKVGTGALGRGFE